MGVFVLISMPLGEDARTSYALAAAVRQTRTVCDRI
jgi:hypothetical protein